MPDDRAGCGDEQHMLKNGELLKFLLGRLKGLLPPNNDDKFQALARKLEGQWAENCAACRACPRPQPGEKAKAPEPQQEAAPPKKDHRRQRFLLRLVGARVAHLIFGASPILPKTTFEGIDRYLLKAMGEATYEQLNREADALLQEVATDDDKEMWARIAANPEWRYFANAILARILLRFEVFPNAKRTFMSVVGVVDDAKFHALFDALFASVPQDLEGEEQRAHLDAQFGDGTAERAEAILKRAKDAKAALAKPVAR